MELAILLPALAGIGILLVVALRMLRRARARYKELAAKTEAARRELADLRRDLVLLQTAARVERAAAIGMVSEETARRLLEHVAAVAEEVALQGRPY